MGFFDRLFRRTPSDVPPPAPGTATVPPGHRLYEIPAPSLPASGQSPGGVWLAHLGRGTDEAAEDLDRLLAEVDALTHEPRPGPLLASRQGPVSELFAPSNPRILRPPGLLVWTGALDALAGAPEGPRLVERLLRRMQDLRALAEPPAQVLYLLDGDRPRACRVAEHVLALGIDVRLPDPRGQVVLVEVQRPDALLTALVGQPWGVRGKEPGEDMAFDADRLRPDPGDPPVLAVQQATRLRRLTLAAIDAAEGADRALEEELRQRKVPLLVMVDPKTKGVPLRSWPGGLDALPVYPDHAAFGQSAVQMGIPSRGVMSAIMTPHELFPWVAEQGWALALNAFRGDEALYLPLDADVVRRLAGGVG